MSFTSPKKIKNWIDCTCTLYVQCFFFFEKRLNDFSVISVSYNVTLKCTNVDVYLGTFMINNKSLETQKKSQFLRKYLSTKLYHKTLHTNTSKMYYKIHKKRFFLIFDFNSLLINHLIWFYVFLKKKLSKRNTWKIISPVFDWVFFYFNLIKFFFST